MSSRPIRNRCPVHGPHELTPWIIILDAQQVAHAPVLGYHRLWWGRSHLRGDERAVLGVHSKRIAETRSIAETRIAETRIRQPWIDLCSDGSYRVDVCSFEIANPLRDIVKDSQPAMRWVTDAAAAASGLVAHWTQPGPVPELPTIARTTGLVCETKEFEVLVWSDGLLIGAEDPLYSLFGFLANMDVWAYKSRAFLREVVGRFGFPEVMPLHALSSELGGPPCCAPRTSRRRP